MLPPGPARGVPSKSLRLLTIEGADEHVAAPLDSADVAAGAVAELRRNVSDVVRAAKDSQGEFPFCRRVGNAVEVGKVDVLAEPPPSFRLQA